MAINAKNGVGWLVFIVGLGLVAATIAVSFNYFTGKQEFPRVFKFSQMMPKVYAQAVNEASAGERAKLDDQIKKLEEMSKSMTDYGLSGQQALDPQQQIQGAVNQAITNILPAGTVEKILNMVAWSVFATFLVYAGAKIAEIGIKMIS